MYVICDNRNIVRAIARRAVYVKAQTNGVTILADKKVEFLLEEQEPLILVATVEPDTKMQETAIRQVLVVLK